MSIRIIRILTLLLMVQGFVLHGQDNKVSLKVDALLQSTVFERFDPILKREPLGGESSLGTYVREHEVLQISSSIIEELQTSRPGNISISLPLNAGEVIANLYQVSPFASSFKLRASDGRQLPAASDMVFYHGVLEGRAGSLCAVSIAGGEIRVMYADKSGVHRIHKLRGGEYVYFRNDDMLQPTLGECSVDQFPGLDMTGTEVKSSTRSSGSCVEVYFECDYRSFTDNNSSLTSTLQWVGALFNEVSIIYDNEAIPIGISEVFVWTSTDPYAGLGSTSAVLNEFVDQIASNGYTGRLAHFLSTRGLGGGIAYVDVLCSQTVPCAVSASLSTNIVPFPDYSWNVNVVAHELGHNFGSRHTHRCVWNGNNTQIDDCGNEWASNPEGASCYDEQDPILPGAGGGTVMSYCHLIGGVGINPANGFGQQPGDLIRSEYNNASCTTGSCTEPNCTTVSTPSNGETDVSVSTSIIWDVIPSALGYYVTIGTTPGGTDIADAVDNAGSVTYDPGELPFDQEIFVEIIPYNAFGQQQTCTESSFTTESDVAPSCTQLSFPSDGATGISTSVNITWPPPLGNESGYFLNVGTTPSNGDIVSNADVGDVISYLLVDLPDETEIYVRVTPYGPQGNATGCTTTSFTTGVAQGGDQCVAATTISCGTTAIGSTLQATEDDVSNCGTSVSAPGVWYTFTGSGENVVLSMCGAADYDTKINVYRGSCGNLICVAGNDDRPGCNYASQVEFQATSGTQYYVLINGWNGQIGNFALAMACENDNYCPAQGILATDEWIASVAVDGSIHTSGAQGYSDFTDVQFSVRPGIATNVTLTPGFAGDPLSEYFRVWVDLDNDNSFESSEIMIESGSTTTPLQTSMTIPGTTAHGDYRMRIAMKYNSVPDDCDVFTYGEVEDYTIRIRCNVVTSAADSGPGTLREILSCVQQGDTIVFDQQLSGSTISLTSEQLQIDSDVVIDGGNQQIVVAAGVANRTFQLSQGVNASFIDFEVIGGGASVGSAILNYGNLSLQGVRVRPNIAGEREVLTNFGELTIGGDCDIQRQ